MLDLGPDYSPKAMSTISFPSPPTRGATLLFETDEMDNSPQHIETRQPSAAAQSHRKPVQYYDPNAAAQAEVSTRILLHPRTLEHVYLHLSPSSTRVLCIPPVRLLCIQTPH